ncbi:uncharacterized protein PG998_000791 [Apiospora kogelbergensis]|uniref:uncharacterized protein n=1 Tax=Apiospora kogelbergensis TaxID=1337665 RepID=UPI00312E20A0
MTGRNTRQETGIVKSPSAKGGPQGSGGSKLTGEPSPILVIIYSKAAEAIVRLSTKIDKENLNILASSILRSVPTEIVHVSKRLAETAELAARSIQHFDVRDMISQVKKDLLVRTSGNSSRHNQGVEQYFGGRRFGRELWWSWTRTSMVTWSQDFGGRMEGKAGLRR